MYVCVGVCGCVCDPMRVCVCVCVSVHMYVLEAQKSHEISMHYGVATCSRLLKIIGLFCKRAL